MSCPNRDLPGPSCTKWGCDERAAGCPGEMRGVTSSGVLVLLDEARRLVSASAPSRRAAAGPTRVQATPIVRIHPGYEPGRATAA